jgi:formylglycine-generating enzyme required for sulfatase activity
MRCRTIAFLPACLLMTACQVVAPDSLWKGVSSPAVDAGAAALPTPVALPASCQFDASSVVPSKQVDVAPGAYAMGCNPKADTECAPDEDPEHMVTLDDFAVDETEVTQAQYALCVQKGACTNPYCAWNACTLPNRPIACVDRAQAIAYCAFVNETLPTEAQWEKAARGTDGRKFPWGDDPISCDLANMDGCSTGTMDVGSLLAGASPYGALDMAGNVVEWTLDFYSATYYGQSPADDPKGPATGSSYSGRGGGWLSDESWQRTSARDEYEATYVKDSMGFRCVRNGSPT